MFARRTPIPGSGSGSEGGVESVTRLRVGAGVEMEKKVLGKRITDYTVEGRSILASRNSTEFEPGIAPALTQHIVLYTKPKRGQSCIFMFSIYYVGNRKSKNGG